ncbi:ATP-binding cassette domain-containing protein [Micromonospora sp. M12]
MNCLAGLLPLTAGSIWQDERRIDTLPPERRGFGMVFQSYALFPHLTVRANIAFGLRMRRLPKEETRRRTEEAVRLVRLEDHVDKLPGQLSGGQQQRVAIARAVVFEPSLVLMDEPLSNLDAKLRLEMRTEIRRLHQSLGLTTVYVTHDQEEALSLADRLVVLREGRVQQIGSRATCTPGRQTGTSPTSWATATCGAGGWSRWTAPGHRRVVRPPPGRRRGGRPPDRDGRGGRGAPEDIRVDRAGETGNAMSATVEVVEYQGREFAAEARTDTGLLLHLRTEQRIAPGDQVKLAIDPQRLLVYPETGHLAHASGRRGERRRPGRPLAHWQHRLAERGIDRQLWLLVPALIFVVALFLYPFFYGLTLSFQPTNGGPFSDYSRFFSDAYERGTIWITLRIALPAALLNVLAAVPIAYRMRGRFRGKRLVTTLLVVPITLGTVLTAQGLLNFLGPTGWFNRTLLATHLVDEPVRLTHNYWECSSRW